MRRLTFFVTALALVAAACGGDTTDTSEAQSTTTAAEVVTTTTAGDATTTTAGASAATGPVSFVAGDGTQVSFVIAEVLRGDDTIVTATNRSVDVSATVDFDAGTADLGVITIAAGDFVTDEDRRDGAIDRFILQVSDHPEIVFTPTDTSGLAASGGQVVGDLTIRDVTNEVTFDVVVDAAGSDGITASATATVDRTAWGLNIPSVPFVANVAEEVELSIDLVLVPTS